MRVDRLRAFVIGEAAFGADEQGGGGGFRGMEVLIGPRFVEEVALRALDGLGEIHRVMNHRQARTAALLGAFEQNLAPTLDALGGGHFQAFLRPRADEGLDDVRAELGGFLEDPLELVELHQRQYQRDLAGIFGDLELFENFEAHQLLVRGGDFGEIKMLLVGDLIDVSRLHAQDLGEMFGVLTAQLGVAGMDGRNEEETPGHLQSEFRTMIAHLRGLLLEKHPNQCIVECAGVGYDVVIPVSTFSSLPDAGAEVKLRIHTHVREDALSLFGFLSVGEKNLFERLIGVSGVGPKLAVTILSGLAVGDLVSALRTGDVQKLQRVPGIGKKTAERLVLELRDKVDGVGALPGGAAPAAPRVSSFSAMEEDVLSGLMNLGCARPAAESALAKAKAAGAGDDFETLFRKALEMVR